MKKNILKITAMIFAIILCFSFVGCNESAYEIALKEGFVGTEEEWLESLRGTNGKDGKDNDITIEDLYEAAKNNGYTGNFNDFLQDYLNDKVEKNDISYATNEALKSAVSIRAEFVNLLGKSSAAGGAGVIYKLIKTSNIIEAYIITNYHVVYDVNCNTQNKISTNITFTAYGNKELVYGKDGNVTGDKASVPAKYVGGSMMYDIAVLKADCLKGSTGYDILATLEPVEIADSDFIKLGTTAIAIGNPAGNGIAATSGIVSVDSEYITIPIEIMDKGGIRQLPVTYRCMRVDTAINHGNSGGGLFNSDGKLLGIVNAKTESNSIDNIGYAIPSNLAVAVADNIIWNSEQNGKSCVTKGLLGVMLKVDSSSAVYNEEKQMTEIVEKVVIDNIDENVPAKEVLEIGDEIIAIGKNSGEKRKVTRMFMVVDFMLTARPGDTINVEVKRKNEIITKDFRLTENDFRDIG